MRPRSCQSCSTCILLFSKKVLMSTEQPSPWWPCSCCEHTHTAFLIWVDTFQVIACKLSFKPKGNSAQQSCRHRETTCYQLQQQNFWELLAPWWDAGVWCSGASRCCQVRHLSQHPQYTHHTFSWCVCKSGHSEAGGGIETWLCRQVLPVSMVTCGYTAVSGKL